jgi:hypothetical protein
VPRSFGFTVGPLLFPGFPLTPVESCDGCVDGFILPLSPELAPVDPIPFSPGGFTAGPLLLPGFPLIPGLEFGVVLGKFSAANAGANDSSAAVTAPMTNFFMEGFMEEISYQQLPYSKPLTAIVRSPTSYSPHAGTPPCDAGESGSLQIIL